MSGASSSGEAISVSVHSGKCESAARWSWCDMQWVYRFDALSGLIFLAVGIRGLPQLRSAQPPCGDANAANRTEITAFEATYAGCPGSFPEHRMSWWAG